MYPSLEEVKKLADTGKYKRIPVMDSLYSDHYTTVLTLKKLRRASNHVYLLESASQSESWGRYSFLGYDPKAEITCTDGNMKISERLKDGSIRQTDLKTDHPKEQLREFMKKYISPKIQGMPPFCGGLVGYFSYDYIKYSEPRLYRKDEGEEFKDLDLMLFDRVIAFDHYRQKIDLIAGVDSDDPEGSYEDAIKALKEMRDLLENGEGYDFKPLKLNEEIKPVFDEKTYGSMVTKAKEYIRNGDIFQVVLSDPMTAGAEGNLLDTYRVLRANNPSPYLFYFASDDIEMAGSSPETLVKLEGDKLFTFPLAGTRPRGKTRKEDVDLERDLLLDEKEQAEHNMLVDLGRNDMGRVSMIGSVRVEDYMQILRFSQVMHIGSTVTGKIDPSKDALDAVDAILPAGTLSGAPKIRACEIIEELEGNKRGIYGGAVGYLDFSGNMDICIAIRLVYKKNGKVCIRSGAGIVADSIPEKEFNECRNKAKAIVLAIKEAGEELR